MLKVLWNISMISMDNVLYNKSSRNICYIIKNLGIFVILKKFQAYLNIGYIINVPGIVIMVIR